MQISRRMRRCVVYYSAINSPVSFCGYDSHWKRCSIQAARSSMRRGDCRVVAGTLDSGTCRHAEAECTTRLQRLFLPTFSGATEKVGHRRHRTMSIVRTVGQSRPPLNQSASPVRLHVVHPVIFAFTNCPISRSPPVMRTRRPPSVRAVSRSPSFPSTSTRIVLPTYA